MNLFRRKSSVAESNFADNAEFHQDIINKLMERLYHLNNALPNSQFKKIRNGRKLIEETNRSLTSMAKKSNNICKLGCDHCCYQLFKVKSMQFNVISLFLINNPMLLEQFLTNYLHRIEVTGNRTRLKRMFETYTNGSNVGQSNIARRYYKMKIPCAFLNDQGHCLIYGLRPLPCAAFISNNLQSCIKKQGGFMPTEMSQLFNASMRQLENCSVKLDLEADVSTMIFRQLKAIAENEAEALML